MLKSIVFTEEGEFNVINQDLYNGKNYFRKMTTSPNEQLIAKLLMKYPHPNIVNIYHVDDDYIDMELVDTPEYNINTLLKIKKIMMPVKDYLQSIGIIYIDWKLDNIGIINSNYKLFDFNGSGIIDVNSGKWQYPPVHFYKYQMATENNGMKKPIQIDNFSFVYGFLDDIEELFDSIIY